MQMASEQGAEDAVDGIAASSEAHAGHVHPVANQSYDGRSRRDREGRIVWPGFGMSMLWLAAGFAALGGAVWTS